MRCENTFCIYSKNNICILDSISINNLCMCDDCIIINLDEETLNLQKKILLDKYDKMDY